MVLVVCKFGTAHSNTSGSLVIEVDSSAAWVSPLLFIQYSIARYSALCIHQKMHAPKWWHVYFYFLIVRLLFHSTCLCQNASVLYIV